MQTNGVEFERFMKWALPEVGLRWKGFEDVAGQVRDRVIDRMVELGLGEFDSYREYLIRHPDEWAHFDRCCRVTISRFYRDAQVVDRLRECIVDLAARSDQAGRPGLRMWSAGAASGEEPYTLSACWEFDVAEKFPELDLALVASEAEEHMVERAERAVYPASSLREIPDDWHRRLFEGFDGSWRLRNKFRERVQFVQHDIRDGPPPQVTGTLDVIACRYLAFTYFDGDDQMGFLDLCLHALSPGGILVVGLDEIIPTDSHRLRARDETESIFEFRSA